MRFTLSQITWSGLAAWALHDHSLFKAAEITSSIFFFTRYKAKRWRVRSDINIHPCCGAPSTSKAAGWEGWEAIVLCGKEWEECDSRSSAGRDTHRLFPAQAQVPFTDVSRPGLKASPLDLAEAPLLHFSLPGGGHVSSRAVVVLCLLVAFPKC